MCTANIYFILLIFCDTKNYHSDKFWIMSNLLLMKEDAVRNASYFNEEPWDFEKFKEKLEIKVISINSTENAMEFDIIGINLAIANAFRRILLSEVPSMAIEKVGFIENKTVLPEEVLAHRFGLIPLKVNPRLFQFRTPGDIVGTEWDTLHYELKVKCTKNPQRRYGHYRSEDMYINHMVYSKDIKWQPIGQQELLYKEIDVKPLVDDIVIAKMRPGHELHVKLEAVKGIGKNHAKFSPVATASYRLHPHIKLLTDIENEQAELLKNSFSPGVIDIVKDKHGRSKAVVKNSRIDSCSRNVLNEPDIKDKVEIGRKKDHVIFNIESAISVSPEDLFREAIKTLKKKCAEGILEVNKVSEKKRDY